MSEIYQEEEEEENTQINDLNIEADRVIAMNPTGVIENFSTHEENVNGKKIRCDGNSCIVLGDVDEVGECVNGICNKSTSYSTYIIYFVIFISLCALAYFFYKKYYCKS